MKADAWNTSRRFRASTGPRQSVLRSGIHRSRPEIGVPAFDPKREFAGEAASDCPEPFPRATIPDMFDPGRSEADVDPPEIAKLGLDPMVAHPT
ncbi:MAG TPA: hypothetical protein VGF09_00690 [Solirubrobacterales bacterium]